MKLFDIVVFMQILNRMEKGDKPSSDSKYSTDWMRRRVAPLNVFNRVERVWAVLESGGRWRWGLGEIETRDSLLSK